MWVAVQATLLLVLFRRRLVRSYRWFASYLFIGLVQQIALRGLDIHSLDYAFGWSFFEFAHLTLLGYAAIELIRKVLDHYEAILGFASTCFGLLFTLTCVLGAVGTMPSIGSSNWLANETYLALKFLRWESLALFLFLCSTALWFSVYPIAMRRNVRLHLILLALYGGAIPWVSVLLIESTQNARSKDAVNLAMSLAEITCLATWSVCFTRTGERERTLLPLSEAEGALRESKYAETMASLRSEATVASFLETIDAE